MTYDRSFDRTCSIPGSPLIFLRSKCSNGVIRRLPRSGELARCASGGGGPDHAAIHARSGGPGALRRASLALPALCDAVTKAAPANSLRAILYPNARHAFDVRSLPERAEFGRLGYNAAAAQASWETVLEFLR